MKIISKKSGKAGEVIEEKMVNSKLTYIVQFDGAKNRVAVLAANCEVVKEADHLPEVMKEVQDKAVQNEECKACGGQHLGTNQRYSVGSYTVEFYIGTDGLCQWCRGKDRQKELPLTYDHYKQNQRIIDNMTIIRQRFADQRQGIYPYAAEEAVDLNQFRTLWSPVEHFLSHPEDMPVNPYLKNPARKPVGYARDVILAECEMEARAALPVLKPDPLKPPSVDRVKTACLPPSGVHKYI